MTQLQLLTAQEAQLRLARVRKMMQQQHVGTIILSDFANIAYLTGRVFSGYVVVDAEAPTRYFVQRPTGI